MNLQYLQGGTDAPKEASYKTEKSGQWREILLMSVFVATTRSRTTDLQLFSL